MCTAQAIWARHSPETAPRRHKLPSQQQGSPPGRRRRRCRRGASFAAPSPRPQIPELPQCDYDTEEQTRQAADEASDKENANGGEDSPKGCPAPRQQPSDATLARAVAGMALGTAPRSPLAPLQASEPAAAGGTGQEPEAGGTPGKPEAAGDGSAAAKRHAAAAADETAAGRQVVAPPVADGAAAAGAAAGAVQVEPALRGLLRRLSQPFEEAAQGAAQLPLNLLEVQQHVALTTHIGPHMAEAAAAPGAQVGADLGWAALGGRPAPRTLVVQIAHQLASCTACSPRCCCLGKGLSQALSALLPTDRSAGWD